MKIFCFVSLGLLLLAGCSDTATDYEVEKPVITEPAPHMPVVTPEADSDLDVDIEDDVDTDESNVPSADVDTNVDAGATPDTSGAIESDNLDEENAPANP